MSAPKTPENSGSGYPKIYQLLPGQDPLAAPEGYILGREGPFMRRDHPLFSAVVRLPEISFLPDIKPFLVWRVPRIPWDVFARVLRLFIEVYEIQRTEAVLHLYYHPRGKKFKVVVKEQLRITGGTAAADPNTQLFGFVFLGSIHSHAGFEAFHSGTDQASEAKLDGLHIVVGNLNSRGNYSISAVITASGNRFPVNPEEVIENLWWSGQPRLEGKLRLSDVIRKKHVEKPKPLVIPVPPAPVQTNKQTLGTEIFPPEQQAVVAAPAIGVAPGENTPVISPVAPEEKVVIADQAVITEEYYPWYFDAIDLLEKVKNWYFAWKTRPKKPKVRKPSLTNLYTEPDQLAPIPPVSNVPLVQPPVAAQEPLPDPALERRNAAGELYLNGSLPYANHYGSFGEGQWGRGAASRYDLLVPEGVSPDTYAPPPEWLEKLKESFRFAPPLEDFWSFGFGGNKYQKHPPAQPQAVPQTPELYKEKPVYKKPAPSVPAPSPAPEAPSVEACQTKLEEPKEKNE